MPINLIPHTKGKQQLIVSQKDTAVAYGSGLVPVLATPAMIALMELTAHTSIQQQLPDQLTTVGFAVDMKHLKASKIGNTLVCESELIEITDRKLVFNLKVWDEGVLAGQGTHIRYIIEKSKFV